MNFKKGSSVERILDGIWFCATINSIDTRRKTAGITYADDGNEEDDVPLDEIRISEGKYTAISNNSHPETNNKLLRPLAGLIEDDSEARKFQPPTVIVHQSGDSSMEEPAIIINGADSKLAVGGGLRAIKYLKC